ncbi:MAG: thiamine phosphate synthase [Bacteroidetes bacterium]|nr:thiamine phosphate synthase [Bacteroidota bacterium]
MYDLYLVTDEKMSLERDISYVVEQAVEGGVTMVQLREKELNTREFIKRSLNLKKLLSKYDVPLIINDRVDIALAVEADGVHVGQSDMPYEYVKRLIPEKMMLGLSVETLDQAVEAEKYDLDYLSVSPVFFTPTKTNLYREWGIEGLRKLRSITKHKLIAIGGINSSNVAEVIRAGADGVAVVSAICAAEDPKTTSKELKSIIEKIKKSKTNDKTF